MSHDPSLTASADAPLPEGLEDLAADARFRFACHPGVTCFNRCCHDLALPLTPYDVMILCRHLGMDGENFLERYATVRTFPETGFPLPFLNMDEVENLPCPFVGPQGCTVYPARPAACRSYPLGRGTRLGRSGVEERHFLVREAHCRGFENGEEWTPPRHVRISPRRAEDVLFDDAATLDFGLDWLELVIFGRCPGLSPAGTD